ncbi:PSP1 domain-containing protein [Planctomicrobium piriforme]|uniref:Cell fate regulator YaaT, PSP1 superfamily (Controls sporulation, competence, biofilm development) n=1 Tax=Planctomicrobium piriforme TaxID=1576369 RepID=A0A1I3BFW4_9PLAN|nr:regulatory iron-sulfur-containing complex subunit RicT [Planctomicrobium piriforme]SFH61184.1 Cell fate regulator YaaT, PSP1 superfamily (controls sporulation, competence, biofilm development) [Planctomicrobium piriforme]
MAQRYVVRYGSTRQIGEFAAKGPPDFARGAQVIVRSPRGTEWGEVLCEATDRTKEYLGRNDPSGKVIREATPDDERTRETLWHREQEIFQGCRRLAGQYAAGMQLVDVEQLFGGEKVIVYYVSEARIDFRELVKALAREFQARIEMRQIGIRDEAKLLADYGDCGKPVCCNTHLTEMPPVSMKMAKVQKASLDPNKISGRCGRLKCCLRYEYDTYEAYRRELPKVGKMVITKQGQGKVLAQEILAQKLLVSFEDNRRLMIDAADVITVIGGQPHDGKSKASPADHDHDSEE